MGFSWDLNDFTNQTWDISGDFSLTDITEIFFINGHFRTLNWRYPPCIRPM